MTPDDEARAAREVTDRAIRRLGWLETILMLAAGLMALLAGAVTALLVSDLTGMAFRIVWIGASLVFFVVPGSMLLVRTRREEAARRARLRNDHSTEE